MSGTVLLTGAMGYVGGRIAQTLAEKNSGTLRMASRTPPIHRPVWLARGEMVALDLFSDEDLQKACSGVNCIVHFAAMNEIDCAQYPQQALQVNGLGTLRLLQAAISAGVERFIYFSTAHVYGAPLVGDIDEELLPRPIHPYAITHRVAEDFVLAAHDCGDLTGIVVRLSNGLGAPTHPEVNRWTLIGNDLCRQAVQNKELTLRSSGLQWRDFVTMTDVGRAVLHLMGLSKSACGNGLFNLGGANSMRIIDLATHIAERCGEVLGYVPPITRPQPNFSEKDIGLTYRMDKLLSTGFKLSGNFDEEVDATLRLCNQYFGGAR
ncbi:NAD-dependent epimerase/dehydratase family protein [Sulfurirhabdus autotrophica]|uniref:UDP-glucose 4-epimerase n=1 Tax=Sulfurirhabdus autotrophica TaxID=1706046 RepID=A0A4R3Y1Z7_9PROT|nr:SDR family oxidoreductase [Sulfurirhabdus autotrophica]TCV84274.1 UDP-glucose 4-epimerase [Sulfurirhabdus autotrophica]